MFDTKRKELNVQGLACTFSLPNVDAYFLVNDEPVLYKSKVVASGVMYRILGENTDIVVFVDTIPYIEHNAMSYDEVVHVEFENLDYKEVEILLIRHVWLRKRMDITLNVRILWIIWVCLVVY